MYTPEFSIEDYTKEYQVQLNALKDSIARIGQRQSEIQSYIGILSTEVNNLQVMVNQKTVQPAEKSKMYGIIARSMELLTEFYTTISQFESTRCQYQRELVKLVKDKNQFLYLDLTQLEAKTNKTNQENSEESADENDLHKKYY